MSSKVNTELLHAVAKQAGENAFCEYSNFPVGASVQCQDGTVIAGCNVENVSFGLTNCAERTALFSAIAQGYSAGSFVALNIYTPTQTVTTPCGACRQVMAQLMPPDALVTSVCLNDKQQSWHVSELLPDGFDF